MMDGEKWRAEQEKEKAEEAAFRRAHILPLLQQARDFIAADKPFHAIATLLLAQMQEQSRMVYA